MIDIFEEKKKQIYLKSPFNYTGSKYKLLNKIYPYFPKDVNKFYDLFAGGGSVFINSGYKNIVINDVISPLIKFYKNLKDLDFNEVLSDINKCKISKDSQEEFLKLRKEFNIDKNEYKFFCLVSSCTNNLMRFNLKGEFNQTFGKRTVNDSTVEKLKLYSDKIKTITNLEIINHQFDDEYFDKINKDDFVYLDPPYKITEAGYNCFWSDSHENRLWEFMRKLDEKNIRFIMSNVSEHKNKKYEQLENCKYFKKHEIINIECDYEKVAKDKDSGKTQEIILKNF